MPITVGVIGLPNVGKSSLINSLKRSHAVNVGSTPGLTRSMQVVQLDKNVNLLDCPGVVLLKSAENDSSIALRNCKRIEKLEDPVSPVKEILEHKLCPASTLVTLYKIPTFDSVDVFLQNVATVRGKLKKGGVLDIEAAARIVLHDWNEGKIPYYTMPPTRNQGKPLEAKTVSVFEKDCNIDEAYGCESTYISSLKSIDGCYHVEVPPSCPLNIDENMHESDIQPEPSSHCNEQVNSATDEAADDAGNGKVRTESSRQNNKLPSQKRKEKTGKSLAAGDAMDDDYDFKVDYSQKGVEMIDVHGDGDDTDAGDSGNVNVEMGEMPSNSS